jgi:hypothetical protein
MALGIRLREWGRPFPIQYSKGGRWTPGMALESVPPIEGRDFILEPDRLRVVSQAGATAFWRRRLQERQR